MWTTDSENLLHADMLYEANEEDVRYMQATSVSCKEFSYLMPRLWSACTFLMSLFLMACTSSLS